MAQYDFGTIDPNTKSGTALASDLNSWRNAVHSTHSGATAPSYTTAAMLWANTTSANYELKMYDGAQWINVAVLDATNNVARVAVDPADTSYITSTTNAQIRHVIANTNIFTTRSTGIQFNLASPVISDSNNNELLGFTTTASAVNQLNIANSATGGAVQLSTVGADTDISIALMPKGAGNVGIGTATPFGKLSLGLGTATLSFGNVETDVAQIGVGSTADSIAFGRFADSGATFVERARIDANGNLLVGKTADNDTSAGIRLDSVGLVSAVRDSNLPLLINRLTNDGTLVDFRQGNVSEGSISVSGTTVSYNGGHLSRWAQLTDNSRPELLKGTVMSNLDQMSNWDGEENEQLNCVQVSTVEGDANVAGVFVAWDSTDDGYNDILLAMTGDMVIRIAAGTTVQRGDLLMSAGDGTAKPQGDDIVRSKTIAKVTSTHVSHTYADGSYAVPCVLMAC